MFTWKTNECDDIFTHCEIAAQQEHDFDLTNPAFTIVK
jgi:hypothetical protein